MIHLILPYPISANRYWAVRVIPKKPKPLAITYVTEESKPYKAAVEQLAKAAGIQVPATSRVVLHIKLFPRRPQDWAKRAQGSAHLGRHGAVYRPRQLRTGAVRCPERHRLSGRQADPANHVGTHGARREGGAARDRYRVSRSSTLSLGWSSRMIGAELRMQKRYRSYVQKHGRCSVCLFRATGAGGFHCKGRPDRASTCDTDRKLPVFRFDGAVLGRTCAMRNTDPLTEELRR